MTDADPPLCVDLDGTLIRSDMLSEALVRLLMRNPLYALALPLWFLRSRAGFKREIASRVKVDPATLPYIQPVVDWLRHEYKRGRAIHLVTASDQTLAAPVADHLGVFRKVLGSDGETNLKGSRKRERLTELFGEKGFDYAGDSTADLEVWPGSRQAIIVNASPALAKRGKELNAHLEIRGAPQSVLPALIRSLRPHQWVKNLIILVPLITSHQIADTSTLSAALLALLAFCLCSSGVYLINDLHDLEADRRHPGKRNRPFASGRLPLGFGLALAPVLFVAAGVVADSVNNALLLVLGLYLAFTMGYSWRLKQIALLDVFVLAGLYTIRLIAGHEATGIPYSVWLLAFSMFIFLSLALLKRFTELRAAGAAGQLTLHRRGYGAGDLDLVTILGLCSGLVSVLVLALYVNSDDVRVLYTQPALLLLMCPLFLYWISRVWLIGHRGEMHDDPVVFALRDPVSYMVVALVFGVLWVAA